MPVIYEYMKYEVRTLEYKQKRSLFIQLQVLVVVFF